MLLYNCGVKLEFKYIYYIIISIMEYIIYIIACLSIAYCQKIIKTQYLSSFTKFTLPITFKDYEMMTYYKAINLEYDYTLLYNTPIRPEKIRENISFHINNEDIPVQVVQTEIMIPNHNITYMFYNVEKMNYYTYANEGISFAYKYSNDNWKNNFSFVYQLIKNGLIDKPIFALEPLNRTVGNLYLGGVPQDVIKEKNMAKCPIVKYNSYWSCYIDKVIFNYEGKENEFIMENIVAQFQPGQVPIKVHTALFEYLYNNLFSYYIFKRVCRLSEYERQRAFDCDIEAMEEFPELKFVINGYIFQLAIKDLYEISHRSVVTSSRDMILLVEDKYNDKVTLGALLMREYISVFDYEDEYINFYSEKKFERHVNQTEKIVLVIYKITIILLLLNIIYLLIIYKRYES